MLCVDVLCRSMMTTDPLPPSVKPKDVEAFTNLPVPDPNVKLTAPREYFQHLPAVSQAVLFPRVSSLNADGAEGAEVSSDLRMSIRGTFEDLLHEVGGGLEVPCGEAAAVLLAAEIEDGLSLKYSR